MNDEDRGVNGTPNRRLRYQTFTILSVVVILLTATVLGVAAGWRDVPIWTVDGAHVDIGFLYEDECVAGPIAVEIQYPQGVPILLVEADSPPYGYEWTTKPRSDFTATDRHIDLRIEAKIPGTHADGCRGRLASGVRITPLDDRFRADVDRGRYDAPLVVRS